MANNKIDCKSMSLEELQAAINDNKLLLQKLTITHAVQGLANPAQVRFVRRNVARLLTEVKERELTASFGERANWPKSLTRAERIFAQYGNN